MPGGKTGCARHLAGEAQVTRLCELFACPRRTEYYRAGARHDQPALQAIEDVLMRQAWFGYRRVVAQLKREGWAIVERSVRRLLKQLQHSPAVGRERVQTMDSNYAYTRYTNLIRSAKFTQPNQVWVADLTYVRLGTRFIDLAVILAADRRAIRGLALSRSLRQSLILDAPKMALTGEQPAIFHSDRGSPYSAWLHTDLLHPHSIKISMSHKAKPMQNGRAERFMRTLKEAHVD